MSPVVVLAFDNAGTPSVRRMADNAGLVMERSHGEADFSSTLTLISFSVESKPGMTDWSGVPVLAEMCAFGKLLVPSGFASGVSSR